MTITLTDVQAALIAKIKADTATISLLSDGAKDVREIEWVGTVFKYPNIRVRVEAFQRVDADCDKFDVIASVLIFGEDASSKLTNVIASAVFDLLDRKNLSSNLVKPVTRMNARQLGANYITESGVWQSEVRLAFQVT